MKIRGWFFSIIALLACPAHAQTYAELSYGNIAKTMIRFGALDLNNNAIINDYMKLNDCDRYLKLYRDDFGLEDARAALRKDMVNQAAGFADAYFFKSKMYLDKYDFASKSFRLDEKSRLKNTNSFFLAAMRDNAVCVTTEGIDAMPKEVGAVLDQPVTLEGLPITEERARRLLQDMNATGNIERAIYARFSLMIVFAPPVDPKNLTSRYNMDAQLLTIEFFEDAEFKKPIWVFTRT